MKAQRSSDPDEPREEQGMRTVVVYESMFGNTHEVAEQIAASFNDLGEVRVCSTKTFAPADAIDVDLLILGGPTHLHGMTSKVSRRSAAQTALEDPTVDLDDEFGGPGLREWIRDLPQGNGRFCAAFDTRADKPEILTGSAARGIARRLHHHGYVELLDHESFVLDGNGPMAGTEIERVQAWAHALAKRCKVLNIV